MKKHEPLSTAKAVLSLLVLGIVYVLYLKFQENQDYLFGDLNALRSYVTIAIVASGLLVGLMYLASQTTHSKSVKASKSSKKKK